MRVHPQSLVNGKMGGRAQQERVGHDRSALAAATPTEARRLIRAGEWRAHTVGLCLGFAQANLVIVPGDVGDDFLLFCKRNPKPCPVLEVMDRGSPFTRVLASSADVRTDLPLYRIYENGKLVAEVEEIAGYWRDHLMAVLIGCSYTFDHALHEAGIPLRHLQEGRNVPMFVTRLACRPAGRFRGPMVVSMRPIRRDLVHKAVEVTARFEHFHGAPVEVGDPSRIGIADVNAPDWGEPIACAEDEAPVFWACGVTPQAVALHARLRLMITHAPGHMFISDLRFNELLGESALGQSVLP